MRVALDNLQCSIAGDVSIEHDDKARRAMKSALQVNPKCDMRNSSGITRSSREATALVPAVSTIVRARGSRDNQTPDNPPRRGFPPSTDSSNRSIRSVSPNRRVGNPGQASQPSFNFGNRMNLPQASFVAGAAIQQAHSASQVALDAASAAESFQRESHQSTVADAEAAVARTQSQAREFVENTISSAQQAVGRSELELQQRAQQYVREQEQRLRSGMEQELSRLRGEAHEEVSLRERRSLSCYK